MSAPPSEELVRHRLRLCAGRGCLACGVELRLSELVDAVLAIADPWIADRIRLSLLRALLRLADDEGGPRMTVLGTV